MCYPWGTPEILYLLMQDYNLELYPLKQASLTTNSERQVNNKWRLMLSNASLKSLSISSIRINIHKKKLFIMNVLERIHAVLELQYFLLNSRSSCKLFPWIFLRLLRSNWYWSIYTVYLGRFYFEEKHICYISFH